MPALLIGVSHYLSDDLEDTISPAHAVGSFAVALTTSEKPLFRPSEVLTLLNPNRTSLFDALGSLSTSQGDVLILFSGHCVSKTDNPHDGTALALPETILGDVAATGLGLDKLAEFLRKFRARRISLILDCCYGGSLKVHLNVKDIHKKPHVSILSACGAFESSAQGELISPFMREILREITHHKCTERSHLLTMQHLYHAITRAEQSGAIRDQNCEYAATADGDPFPLLITRCIPFQRWIPTPTVVAHHDFGMPAIAQLGEPTNFADLLPQVRLVQLLRSRFFAQDLTFRDLFRMPSSARVSAASALYKGSCVYTRINVTERWSSRPECELADLPRYGNLADIWYSTADAKSAQKLGAQMWKEYTEYLTECAACRGYGRAKMTCASCDGQGFTRPAKASCNHGRRSAVTWQDGKFRRQPVSTDMFPSELSTSAVNDDLLLIDLCNKCESPGLIEAGPAVKCQACCGTGVGDCPVCLGAKALTCGVEATITRGRERYPLNRFTADLRDIRVALESDLRLLVDDAVVAELTPSDFAPADREHPFLGRFGLAKIPAECIPAQYCAVFDVGILAITEAVYRSPLGVSRKAIIVGQRMKVIWLEDYFDLRDFILPALTMVISVLAIFAIIRN